MGREVSCCCVLYIKFVGKIYPFSVVLVSLRIKRKYQLFSIIVFLTKISINQGGSAMAINDDCSQTSQC